MPHSILPVRAASSLAELWSPRVIAELNDGYVKVAKVYGTFGWHAHDHEDELFFILKGRLRIEFDGAEAVELNEGELFVVPKGVRHNPVAEEECLVMLIEKKSTLHSGNEKNEWTRTIEEQLRAD